MSSACRWLLPGGGCWREDTEAVVGLSTPRRWLELLSPGGKVTEAGLCPPEKGAPDRVGGTLSDNILSCRSRSQRAHLCSLFLLTFPAFCFCSRLTVTGDLRTLGESPMSNPGLEQPFCQSNHDLNIWTTTPIINQHQNHVLILLIFPHSYKSECF